MHRVGGEVVLHDRKNSRFLFANIDICCVVFDNPQLVQCNAVQIRSQMGYMLFHNWGNDSPVIAQDIGVIKPSPSTAFNHIDICTLLLKVQSRNSQSNPNRTLIFVSSKLLLNLVEAPANYIT
ncbi:hypothetical protein D3C75_891750 [compost metagenome]